MAQNRSFDWNPLAGSRHSPLTGGELAPSARLRTPLLFKEGCPEGAGWLPPDGDDSKPLN